MVSVDINELYKQAQDAAIAKQESICIYPESMKLLLEVYMEQERTIGLLEKLIIKMARE